MEKVEVSLIIIKQCEFTANVPNEILRKGDKEVRRYLSSKIDNELDYADTTENFQLIREKGNG